MGQRGFKEEGGLTLACNGVGFKNMLQGGKQWLEAHVNIVNDLNVFPVPDGDTGTNMLLTMQAALEKMEEKMAESPDHEVGVMAAAAAQGALMGARGNSGVILSQFLGGVAQKLAGKKHFTAAEFADAVKSGTEQAYQSVGQPVEGTILTVARAAAEAAQQSVQTNSDVLILLADILKAAQAAQAKTPDLLPLLKEAGVADSGGQGLVYILEGALRFVNNDPVDLTSDDDLRPAWQAAPALSEVNYGYDVQFLLQGEQLNVSAVRAYMETIGQSTLVVGDEKMLKVHLHTHDPGTPLSYGVTQGIVNDVVVENLQEQAKRFIREHTIPATTPTGPDAGAIAVIAVVPGQGLAKIFQSLGTNRVLSGGQTMNPSVQTLLEAVDQVEGEHVLILPNNSNVILAAEQAQTLSPKNVKVIPTKTIPQGIAALLTFNRRTDWGATVNRMVEAGRQAQSIEITQAINDRTYNGLTIKAGDVIGLYNNNLVSVGGAANNVLLDILAGNDMDAYEIMTIYTGQDVSPEQGDRLGRKVRDHYPDLSIEVHEGGQFHANYIISLE